MNMKTWLLIAFLTVTVISASPALAYGPHIGIGIGIGVPAYGYGPYPGYYAGYPYYPYYPYYAAPQPVYVAPPPTYVQPAPTYAQPAPAYAQPAPASRTAGADVHATSRHGAAVLLSPVLGSSGSGDLSGAGSARNAATSRLGPRDYDP